MTFCQRCKQWKIKNGDDYCSYCGYLQMPVYVEPLELKLISEIVTEKKVLFKNNGTRSLDIEILPFQHSFDAVTIQPSHSFTLDVEESKEIKIYLNGELSLQDWAEKTLKYVCIIDKNKQKKIELSVHLKVGPKPIALTDEIRFGEVEEGKKSESWAEIGNKGGIPLHIKDISIEGSSQFQVTLTNSSTLLRPNETLKIPVIWKAPGIDSDLNPDLLGVRIRFKNSSRDLFIPIKGESFKFGLETEPSGIIIKEALSKQTYSQKVTLTNNGTKDIEVIGIEASKEWIQIVSKTNNFTLLCRDSYRKDAVSSTVFNERYAFEVFFSLRDLEEGMHKGTITVRTLQTDVVSQIAVQLHVIRPKKCNDYIGIDFGTTNSVVAIWDVKRGDIHLVEDEIPSTGARTPLIPSVLVFHGRPDNYRIGIEAESEAHVYPEVTVRSIKRIMGYGNERIFFGKKFSPEDLAALIIKKLVEYAENRLFVINKKHRNAYLDIKKAIITVPANFYDLQIRGILDACEMAGIDIEAELAKQAAEELKESVGHDINAGIILDEPSAAALFYLSKFQEEEIFEKDFKQKFSQDENIQFLVFDYGGGTLDVSVVQIGKLPGKNIGIKVLANKGDNNIGGDSIDIAVMNALVKLCKKENKGFDDWLIRANFNELEKRRGQENWSRAVWAEVLRSRNDWKKAAENLKISLDTNIETQFEFNKSGDNILAINSGKINYTKEVFRVKVNRDQMAEWIGKILEKCRYLVTEALQLARNKPQNIDYIIHTGRSSLMPMIQEKVKMIFPKLPHTNVILDRENLKVCVAKGAALYGLLRSGIQTDQHVRLLSGGRRLPHSYGIQVMNVFTPEFESIIEIGREYPTEENKHYDDISGRILNLKFLQNSGNNKNIRGNPDIRVLGDITIDTLADNVPGCDVKFIIDANRKIEVTADGEEVVIKPVRLEEEERWIG